MKKVLIGAGALAVVAGVLYLLFPVQVTVLGGLVLSAIRSADAPEGTTQTETNPALKQPDANVVALPTATTINPYFARLNLGS